MEEVNNKITKIVINKEDELTDIVAGIIDSANERVLLTFAEESDLLISTVNLSVLLETADENNRLLVAQIIQNTTGVRNANSAHITTIETTTLPSEEVWIKEEENRNDRMNPKNVEPQIIKEKQEDGIRINEDIETDGLSPEIVPQLPEFEKRIDKGMKEEKVVNKKKPKGNISPKTKKILLLLIPFFFILVGLIAFIYYKTAPLVRIRIYTESREVSIEKIFTGDPNIKEINFDDLKIPIKEETVEKERSTTVKATGIAYKGEKATGKIVITYKKDEGCTGVEPITLTAGTVVISNDGKYFKLDSPLTLQCSLTPVEASITANEIGKEYNLATGTSFSVQNYSKSEVYAMAPKELTGGTKEEHTVLQQQDVNKAMEELKEIAISEGETELKDGSGGSWEIIQSSIKSEVDKKSIKTGVAIGAEAKETSLDLKVISKATYFLKEGFDQKLSELLTQEAQAKNLFETEKDLVLTLSDEVNKEITVVGNDGGKTRVKVVAKASVEPKVEKEEIIAELKGKKWEEGKNLLKKYIFSDKETEIVFEPENFPQALRHFPTRQGGILIELKRAD